MGSAVGGASGCIIGMSSGATLSTLTINTLHLCDFDELTNAEEIWYQTVGAISGGQVGTVIGDQIYRNRKARK